MEVLTELVPPLSPLESVPMSSSYSTTTSYRTTYVTGSYVPSGSYGRPVESYGRPVESTPLKEPEEGKWKSGLFRFAPSLSNFAHSFGVLRRTGSKS